MIKLEHMKYKDVFSFYFISNIFLSGCAGPISPFGGIEFWSGDGQNFWGQTSEKPSTEFSVYPKRQVLHKPSNFKIELNLAEKPQIKVTYNNKEVTNTFLKSATLQEGPEKQIQYIFKKLNLKPDRRHQIDIYWRANNENSFSHLAYLPPDCPINTARSIASTEPFNPKEEYINTINSTAVSQQLNPSLLAGLIAQESGFNPSRVSRAKAIGLTQVTTIADEEIKKVKPQWQSDPRISKLSVAEIERLISRQEISPHQDWRLNPAQAIEGGALYINYLINYWNLTDNKILLAANPKIEATEVILASYNSGAARVKNKIIAHGEQWLDDEELKEAFRYVNSVESYCYHFSEK